MSDPQPETAAPNGMGVLLAASLLAAVLGSVHAFSVFLAPLELRFGQTRSMVSLTYSLSLVVLTLAVLWGYRWYARWPAGRFVLSICALGAFGALAAALAPGLGMVWLGYSILFGAANGLGYGFGLQIAAQANPGREGVAMGVVTAAYALGSVVAPALYSGALSAGGFPLAMFGLMVVLGITGPVCAAMMRASGAVYHAASPAQMAQPVSMMTLVLLWLGYGAGVATGLMTLGHAAGISQAIGYEGPGWLAPVVISVCNLLGSLVAGRLADGISPISLLTGLPLFSAISAILLAIVSAPSLVMIWLGMIGFAYGGFIAAFPAMITKIFGATAGPGIYGKVFTAWGVAGLLGPWLAGSLFDLTGSYQVALLVAGVLGMVSSLSVARFRAGIGT